MIDAKRSNEVPASLAKARLWDEKDVRTALHRDFYGKCYLCERLVTRGEMEVEHRRPRKTWKAGTYHWPNLFPACHYCNGRRPTPSVGLLSPGDEVERRLLQRALLDTEGLELSCAFQATDSMDAAAAQTASELQHLHSVETATTFRARCAAREFLDYVHDRYAAEVYPVELRVLRARRRGEPDPDAETELRRLLSRRAPVTMLTRSLVDPSLADLLD